MSAQLLSGGATCGVGRAAAPSSQRNAIFKRPIFVGTASELGLKPAAALRPQAQRSRGVQSVRCSATSSAKPLPWQAAMSEIKKRRDIKTIMIIGAGPIVIGQVS